MLWLDRIVPVAVEFCVSDVEVFEFLVAYLNPGFVLARIQRGANGETRLRSRARD